LSIPLLPGSVAPCEHAGIIVDDVGPDWPDCDASKRLEKPVSTRLGADESPEDFTDAARLAGAHVA
jgi:hypothetical protein